MKKITVVEVNDLDLYPPVQNLVMVLLDKGYKVDLIGSNVSKCGEAILRNDNCKIIDIPSINKKSKLEKWKNRLLATSRLRKLVDESMKDSDYLWTTSMNTIRALGDFALKYKNIMQLMELARYGYLFRDIIKFPVDEYARNSWKVVVPEENRAYIQKVWWNLKTVPIVLPNKPYDINPGVPTPELIKAIDKMKGEKRKIVLYLGGIYPDRDFEGYAKAISKMDNYVLYIVGKMFGDSESMINELCRKYAVEYMGSFSPPNHLALVKYAYIGLLPYKPVFNPELSELNALYCAPNKIYEYSGYGVPMIGSDVLGLKMPFEKYNMGVCCDDSDEDAIFNAISLLDKNHEEMSKNALCFFDGIDLKKIVTTILEDE